ncbi:LysM peptidoglycan-binding domain-containing protein [Candidatus Contubernalis alkaliaceticus]|uniref:LysM peptidoglycan-binding domain-containing protein n=1 Tax=Candidatus Contubernalis alkaliaceticus TaxID=338645 RepID=UPI001F4C0D5C|nr:LysM domain-containing protein [Candidatus Contubernalis alkalaceticus]UNC93115.1 LysM peptidoglycan-binding domain-containing protein [Candidatus Contubernalis alkalaceticus]
MVSKKYVEEEIVEDVFEEDEKWPKKDKVLDDIEGEKMVRRLLNIVVRPGDSLFFFAQTFGVSVHEILAVNPGITNPDLIFPGQIVRIPARPLVGPDPGFARAQYLVRPGDSLFLIAQMFGLTVNLLIQENPQIADPNLIFPGQVINLTVTPPLPPKPPKGTIQIYVSVGETLSSIARRTGVSVQAIIDANPQIKDPNLIFVGQIINVPLS